MYPVSSGFSFKPTSFSSSSLSTQFSQQWVYRKVVVRHSIKSKQHYVLIMDSQLVFILKQQVVKLYTSIIIHVIMVQSMINQDKQFTWSADAFIIILKMHSSARNGNDDETQTLVWLNCKDDRIPRWWQLQDLQWEIHAKYTERTSWWCTL